MGTSREVVAAYRPIDLDGADGAADGRDCYRRTRQARAGSAEPARSLSDRTWLWPAASPPGKRGTLSRSNGGSWKPDVCCVRLSHPRWYILPEHVAGITAVLCEHLDAPVSTLEWSVSGALALPA